MTRISLKVVDSVVQPILEEYFAGLEIISFSKEAYEGAYAMYRMAIDHTLSQLGWTYDEYISSCISSSDERLATLNR